MKFGIFTGGACSNVQCWFSTGSPALRPTGASPGALGVSTTSKPLEFDTAKRRQIVSGDKIGWGETFSVLDAGVEIVVQAGTMEAHEGQECRPSLAM